MSDVTIIVQPSASVELGVSEVSVDLSLFDLTENEVVALQNINATTISTAQWGYLGSMGGQPLEAETDAVFLAHEANNITAQMITDLGNLSGTNSGDQVLPTDFVSAASGGTFSGGITIDSDDLDIDDGNLTVSNGTIKATDSGILDIDDCFYAEAGGDILITGSLESESSLQIGSDTVPNAVEIGYDYESSGGGIIALKEITTPPTPDSSTSYIYPKASDGKMYYTTTFGTPAEREILTDASGVEANRPMIDSDTFVGALSTNVASAESIKAYVDASGGAETNDLSATVTWADVPDTNITEGSVTQHEAALSITESQISDLHSVPTDFVSAASGGAFSGSIYVDVTNGSFNTVYGENTDSVMIGTGDESNHNTFIGYEAGGNGTMTSSHADRNTAVGAKALSALTSGQNNLAIGSKALLLNENGNNNIAIGKDSMAANIAGYENMAIGNLALWSATGANQCLAIGNEALMLNVAEDDNVAVGSNALAKHNDGNQNVQVGSWGQYNRLQGERNTGIGGLAAYDTTGGDDSVFIGYNSGRKDDVGGAVTTPNQCIAIGSGADFDTTTPTNEIVIGYAADGNGDNTVTIGNASVTNNYLTGELSLSSYGSGTYTGTAAKWLAVDSSGNIIEEAPPAGGGGLATSGTNYIYLEADGTATDNGTELTDAYTTASGAVYSPVLSATNRYVIVCPPGQYDLGAGTLVLDTDFIDVKSTTGERDVILITTASDDSSAQSGAAISIETDDCVVVGVVALGKRFQVYNSGGNSYRLINCKGGQKSFGFKAEAAGYHEKCEGDHFCFGSVNTASGVFIDCFSSGSYSFGGSAGVASGTFTRCTSDDGYGIAGYYESVASGSFERCHASNTSYYQGSFAGGSGGGTGLIASGEFYYCISESGESFGGGGGTSVFSGKAYYCLAPNRGCFGGKKNPAGGASSGYGGTFSGEAYYCKAGTEAFASDDSSASTFSGIAQFCTADDYSFSGNGVHNFTGSIKLCISDGVELNA